MASMFGADPDQLDALGNALRNQKQTVDSVINLVTSTLAGTTWVGPAHDQFEGDWNGSFKTALMKLNDAFEMAGADCKQRAVNLRTVMGQYATA